MRYRRLAEDFMKARIGALHGFSGPFGTALPHVVLPDAVVPGVDAAFEAGIARRPHGRGTGFTDIGRRQQGAVHQGFDAVVLDHRGARYLAEKPGRKTCFKAQPV